MLSRVAAGLPGDFFRGPSCHYFSTKLEVTNRVSAAMFFGYLFIGSALFFAMTGAAAAENRRPTARHRARAP